MVEKNCPGKVTSGPLTAPNDKLAESRRALNMARKEMERAKTAACREAGTCPELDFKKSSKARADCIGGQHNYYTVNRVIIACLDFRKFVILKLYTKFRIRQFSFII